MNFRVIDRGSLALAAWDNLAKHGSFFHTAAWADICLEGIPRAHRAVFLCGFEGETLVAGMPAVITRRYGSESFYSMPDGTYGAPIFSDLCPDENRRAYIGYLDEYFKKSAFSKILIADFSGNLKDWSGRNLQRTRHFTHIVSLENPEAYRPRPNVESHLRTGRKRPSEIITIGHPSQIDDFYRLYCLTRKRHNGGPGRTKGFFEAVIRHLGTTDKLYWTAMEAEGQMIGSQIHFLHGDTLFNWQTVSDYDMRQYKPSQMLMHDAIEMAAENGLSKINLGASPPDAEGLIMYKEGWQGVRTEYDILTAVSWWRKLLGR